MIEGAGQWADVFPEGLIPDVLDLVVRAWEDFPKPEPTDYEDPINRRFAMHLQRRKKVLFNFPRFNIKPEQELHDDDGKALGRIDIMFTPHGAFDEQVYFAFECKRLRMSKSNTPAYVGNDGMMRFLVGRYAPGLDHGGMIGYVMDGRCDRACADIKKGIRRHQERLALVVDTGDETAAYDGPFATRHRRENRLFTMHHVLLAVCVPD